MDEILSKKELVPQQGGFDDVYLYNPADHPGHLDYSSSTTDGKGQEHPLLFVFNLKIFEARGELERQEYEQFHYDPSWSILTDWEIKAKRVPFKQPDRGQLLEFIVAKSEDVSTVCESLSRHNMSYVSVMPLQEWGK